MCRAGGCDRAGSPCPCRQVGWVPGQSGICMGWGAGSPAGSTCLHMVPPRGRLGPVSLCGYPSYTSAGSAAGPRVTLLHRGCGLPSHSFTTAGERGKKRKKKAPFGIEFASPSAQGVLGWAREVLGARERGCTGDGVQPHGLSVQHFETAHQLQPKTSSDKNTQKKSWSLKMQITCDAECPCLCVIAKFLDSISQR